LGRPAIAATRGAATDEQGAFLIEQLLGGTYSIEIAASVSERVLNSDTPPAPEPAAGYRPQRWPNTGNTAGVQLSPGGLLDLGDIPRAREPLYRITGVLGGCPNGDDLSRGLQVYRRNAGRLQSFGLAAAVACGERFWVESLAPGEYVLQLNVERVGPVPVGIVTVIDRDVEFNPVFGMPLAISGSVIAPEGFPALDQLRVAFGPGPEPTARIDAAQVARDGKFQMAQMTAEPVEVQVTPVPGPYYISEILYNGAPLRDGILEANPYSVARELRIRIAADGARLAGTVRRNAELAPNSAVILAASPERLKNGFPVHYLANAPAGQFTFSGVPPGSYRAIAVEREAWETELQKPGVLSGLAAAGVQVDLAPGASRELTLEVRWIPVNQ
jgi:hypothetical protein